MSRIAIASRPAWWRGQRSCLYAAHVTLSGSTRFTEFPASTDAELAITKEYETLPDDSLRAVAEVGASMRLQTLLS